MQSNEDILTLIITLCEYHPEQQHYIVSEYMIPKLATNHIRPKQIQQEGQKEGEKKDKVKRRRYIYAEQVLYLTYIAEFSHFKAIKPSVNREEWQKLKQQDIISIYSNVSEEGYNRLQFMQFYLKNRKKSKLIQRFMIENKDPKIPLYKIYKNAEDFKQKQNEQVIYLVETSLNISEILKNKQKYSSNAAIKIQILSNMDGISILSKPSFSITHNTLQK